MLDYNQANVEFAKQLRRNMTPWERKLWFNYLKDYPVRFQRQKAIDNYIVDFFCAKARLVVELDGGGHYEEDALLADEKRTEILSLYNLKVIRFSNLDIGQNFAGVCEAIDIAVRDALMKSNK
jgi:very-short-patch-repair endonuclease